MFFYFWFSKFSLYFLFFFFQAEDGIRDIGVTGVQTCALPIFIYLDGTSAANRWPSDRRNHTAIPIDKPNEPQSHLNYESKCASFRIRYAGPVQIGRASCRERG